ncbi:MAG: thiamine-phosphate synthase family protein [Candidatus Thorarchaeota archaeon]
MVVQLLPALRALVSDKLVQEYGFTQNQVANALGVTQASVSRSLQQLKRFEKYYTPGIRRMAVTLAEHLSKEQIPLEESIALLCEFCRNQKIGGLLCQLHRSENPELATCKVCGEGMTPKFRIGVLNSLTRGAQLLEEASEFTQLIPQVQSQLVMSIPNAKDIDDVAGFPSRIGMVDQKAHTFTGPEFGASTHLSKILLLIQETSPRQQAAIVLKYLPDVERALTSLKLRYIQVNREAVQGGRETDEALLLAIRDVISKEKNVDAVIDKGLVGIEPVTYLFAEDAKKAASQAIAIAQLLVG